MALSAQLAQLWYKNWSKAHTLTSKMTLSRSQTSSVTKSHDCQPLQCLNIITIPRKKKNNNIHIGLKIKYTKINKWDYVQILNLGLNKTIGYVFEHIWSEIIKLHTTSKFEGDPVVETISTMSSTLNIPDLMCPARVFPAFAFTQ